jgi:hypothetical protein
MLLRLVLMAAPAFPPLPVAVFCLFLYDARLPALAWSLIGCLPPFPAPVLIRCGPPPAPAPIMISELPRHYGAAPRFACKGAGSNQQQTAAEQRADKTYVMKFSPWDASR